MYYGIRFKGIHTHDPEYAIQKYREQIGYEPTVVIVRPDYPVRSEHPLLVRSIAGTAVYMLVTHKITMAEVRATEAEWRENQKKILMKDYEFTHNHNMDHQEAVRVALELEQQGIKKPPPIKPPICPHCNRGLTEPDFENLTWWWGWGEGIEPPYWGALRLYVFKRDDYKCWDCGQLYGAHQLNAHHITPKEEGGADSAKNLRTFCIYCHPDLKPIYPDDEQPVFIPVT